MNNQQINSTDAVNSTNPSNNTEDKKTFISQIRDLVIGFLPGPIKHIFEKGLFKIFLILVFVLVLLPPTMVLLAAFWLSLLGKIDNKAISDLRTAYLDNINEGFSIESTASRSNDRLDYFLLFDYDLDPKISPVKVSRQQNIKIGQKILIELTNIEIKSLKPCNLPETTIDLFSIYLGDAKLKTVNKDSKREILTTKDWWDKKLSLFDSNESEPRLKFELSEPINKLSCAYIHIEGSISVFKDLLTIKQNNIIK